MVFLRIRLTTGLCIVVDLLELEVRRMKGLKNLCSILGFEKGRSKSGLTLSLYPLFYPSRTERYVWV